MKYSLYVQPLGLTHEALETMLLHVKRVREAAGGDYVYNLVIDLLADASGSVDWDLIDLIADFAPGGSRKACDNLFVGTGIIPWGASGSPYREGVVDPAYRAAVKARSADLAAQFTSRYTGQISWWHWYVSHEAVINWWSDPAVAAGFRELLKDQVSVLHAARPNTSILFAPAFWSPVLTNDAKSNIRDVFAAVPQINWLHFQDMGGRDWVGANPSVVKQYWSLFRSIPTLRSVRVGVEMFEHRPDYFGAGDPDEVRTRMATYDQLGMSLGASFEIRYWYDIETKLQRDGESPVVAPPPITPPPPPADTTPAKEPVAVSRYMPGSDGWDEAGSLAGDGPWAEVVVLGIR